MSFSFRLQHREQVGETGMLHMRRLGQLTSEIRNEIQNELDGLEHRFENLATCAAFAQQAIENEGARGELTERVRVLTAAMMQHAQQMAELGQQRAFVARLEDDIAVFTNCGSLPPDRKV